MSFDISRLYVHRIFITPNKYAEHELNWWKQTVNLNKWERHFVRSTIYDENTTHIKCNKQEQQKNLPLHATLPYNQNTFSCNVWEFYRLSKSTKLQVTNVLSTPMRRARHIIRNARITQYDSLFDSHMKVYVPLVPHRFHSYAYHVFATSIRSTLRTVHGERAHMNMVYENNRSSCIQQKPPTRYCRIHGRFAVLFSTTFVFQSYRCFGSHRNA